MKAVKFRGRTFPRYKIDDKGHIYNEKGVKLKPWDDGRGYLMVDLMDHDGNTNRVKVHIASAETYHGPRPDGTIVQHDDGNKHNNSHKNLRYFTQKENVAHAQVHIRGIDYLSIDRVQKIRTMLKTMSIKEVSDKLGIKYHVVRDLKNGKTYK